MKGAWKRAEMCIAATDTDEVDYARPVLHKMAMFGVYCLESPVSITGQIHPACCRTECSVF